MSTTALTKRRSTNWKAIILAALILLVVFAWTQGTFDHLLVNVGMNYDECARNGFGATFCGDELRQYQERLGQ